MSEKILPKDYVIVKTLGENRGRMGQARVIINGRILVQFIKTERIWFTLADVEKWA